MRFRSAVLALIRDTIGVWIICAGLGLTLWQSIVVRVAVLVWNIPTYKL